MNVQRGFWRASLRRISWALFCALACLNGAQSAFAANIAWISFHSADNTPSTGAGTAGFLTAPDKGYTDLLTANGHTVTRVVSVDNLDVAPLNAFDLVIIGRSINSGHYQQAAETLAFNTTITKPLIFMSGYIERQNRLGFSSVSTPIPDISGAVRLTVNNPAHPVFAGVALDGTNLMVDAYAAPVLNPVDGTTLQRGISVVTGSLAGGGTLLATVGTVGDAAFGGPIIAEWPMGATLANAAPANVLGGRRLMFLGGSREHDGGNSETAGILDLSPAGQQMFLNAVNYMAVPVPEPTTMMLAGIGAIGLALAARRRKVA